MCRLKVEYDYVGEVLAMLVLTTKDEQFVPLPKTCGVACMLSNHVRYPTVVDLPMRTPGMSP